MLLFAACFSLNTFAQSYDERLGEAMNNSDWFALDSLYNATPKDSISRFMEVLSRCLTGNRLNRPDVSIPAFEELLNTQSVNLGVENVQSSAMMFAMDLSRVGENEKAAAVVQAVIDATRPYSDSSSIETMQFQADLYSALSAYKPYGITFAGSDTGRVPFRIAPVGPEKHNSVLMFVEGGSIDGKEADIVFETGAGVNVISEAMAAKFNLVPLDVKYCLKGIDKEYGRYVIAKELKIGNITITDVPFVVTKFSSKNAEADKYIDVFGIVIGSEVMLRLKDLTFDFGKGEITVPATAPARSNEKPNMCFSSGMNLLAKATVHGTPLTMCIDSGDASFGALGYKFFEQHEEYIKSHAEPDTIRMAGLGGVRVSQYYSTPDMKLTLGGTSVVVPQMSVIAEDKPLTYEYNLGLKTLMLFRKVRFNMVDFVLSTEN